MQLIAESYDLLHNGLGLDNDALHDVFSEWNTGELDSFLIQITAEVFARQDDEATDTSSTRCSTRAGQKGTGRHTAQSALELGAPRHRDHRSGVRALVVGAQGRPGRGFERAARIRATPARRNSPRTTCATRCSRRRSSRTRKASISCNARPTSSAGTSTSARSPRSGAAVASSAPASSTASSEVYASDAAEEPHARAVLHRAAPTTRYPGWRRTVAEAIRTGIPTPAYSSSLAWYDGYRRARLPANLIQAQRDLFGAHTYERVDREGTFHTDWAANR